MKRVYFIFICILIVTGISAQEVPVVQYSMLTKITATWCPFCGTWGWDAYETLLPDNQGKAIIIANHYSGDLRNNTASAIANNLNSFGQPMFYLNNTNQNLTSSSWTSKVDDIKKKINDNYEASPTVNSGITASLNGNALIVKTKTRFFKSAQGEFYLGVYIIEDNVINYQASRSSAALHKNVLRGSVGTEPFGKLISSGSVSAGTEKEETFSVDLNPSWNTDNIKLATIIWKKEGDSYLFNNGYVFENWQTTTSTRDNAIEGVDVKISRSITNEVFVSEILIHKKMKDLNVQLIDGSGKTLEKINYADLSPGIHTKEWDVSNLPPGIYLLHFYSPLGQKTKKILIP